MLSSHSKIVAEDLLNEYSLDTLIKMYISLNHKEFKGSFGLTISGLYNLVPMKPNNSEITWNSILVRSHHDHTLWYFSEVTPYFIV